MFCLLANVNFCKAAEPQEEKFSGKPIVTVFTNFHAGFGEVKEERGFDLERAYLGYQFKYGDGFSGKIVFDVGSSGLDDASLERIAYLKNAFLTYHAGGLELNAGLITLEEAFLQEKFWNRRYIKQSFQYEYKYCSSADLGVLAKYAFSDAVSVDVACSNGEGYKKLNADKGMRYGAGITFSPSKNLTLRAYADLYEAPESVSDAKVQNAFSFFAGYKNERFRLGAEYNLLKNQKFIDNQDLHGISIYGDIKVCGETKIFARWDQLTSPDDWNADKDGTFALFGVEFAPQKHVKLSPNVRAWLPNSVASDAKIYAYLNLLFSL